MGEGSRCLPNLQVAVLIEENIAGLQVAVDDVGGVEEFEGAQHLVDEILNVLGEQLLPRSNHSTQICLHELADEVDVAEDFALLRNVDDVKQAKDILMHQILHDNDLSQHPLRIDQVLHVAQLFNGDLLPRFAVSRGNNTAIGALANQFDSFVLDGQLKHDALEVSAGEARNVRRDRDASGLFSGRG